MTVFHPTPAPVDLEVLPELTGCDDAMRDVFLADFLPVLADDRQLLLAAEEAAAMAEVAHRVKSAARYVGAVGLGDLSEQLEAAGQAGERATAQALRSAWLAEADRVATFIAALPGVMATAAS